jgi:hypothetical protein
MTLAEPMGWFAEPPTMQGTTPYRKRGRTWKSAGKPDRSKRPDGTHREPHEIKDFRQDSMRDTRKTGAFG